MGKRGNFLKAERCGAALDRVRGTENGIDQFRIGSAGVELQQCRLHRVQTFQTFIEERLVELAEINLRSEEHTSELQSLMRISYAVFCLKKKTKYTKYTNNHTHT